MRCDCILSLPDCYCYEQEDAVEKQEKIDRDLAICIPVKEYSDLITTIKNLSERLLRS